MKTHVVYTIYPYPLDKFYKGYSLNPHKRLIQHNNGESRYTREKAMKHSFIASPIRKTNCKVAAKLNSRLSPKS